MATERYALRDWHRLFGLLLTDLFTGSPFVVEKRDILIFPVPYMLAAHAVCNGILPRDHHDGPVVPAVPPRSG
jgi:hypothetical protein